MCHTIALCTNAKRAECGCHQHERGGCGCLRVRASAARGGRRAHHWCVNSLACSLLCCCVVAWLTCSVRACTVDKWMCGSWLAVDISECTDLRARATRAKAVLCLAATIKAAPRLHTTSHELSALRLPIAHCIDRHTPSYLYCWLDVDFMRSVLPKSTADLLTTGGKMEVLERDTTQVMALVRVLSGAISLLLDDHLSFASLSFFSRGKARF